MAGVYRNSPPPPVAGAAPQLALARARFAGGFKWRACLTVLLGERIQKMCCRKHGSEEVQAIEKGPRLEGGTQRKQRQWGAVGRNEIRVYLPSGSCVVWLER